MVQTRAQAARAAQAWPQLQSPFFRLPFEIRTIIYSYLFEETNLSFDKRSDNNPPSIEEERRRQRQGLALLRTCHRINQEIGDSWMSHVCFSFLSLWELMSILTTLSPDKLAKIRFVRLFRPDIRFLKDPSFRLQPWFIRPDSALNTLTGLRLDKLVIFGLSQSHQYPNWSGDLTHPDADCSYLDKLVTLGNGWKELHYICPSSRILAYSSREMPVWNEHTFKRPGPQPQHWQQVLTDRDGASSNPSVTVYRANLPERSRDGTGATWMDVGWSRRQRVIENDSRLLAGLRYDWLTDPSPWSLPNGDFYISRSSTFSQRLSDGFSPNPPPGATAEWLAQQYGTHTDTFLTPLTPHGRRELEKGVRFVIIRGAGVDYTVRPSSPPQTLIPGSGWGWERISGLCRWPQLLMNYI